MSNKGRGKIILVTYFLEKLNYGGVFNRVIANSVFGVFKNEYIKGMQVGNSFTDSSGKQVSTSKSELNDKGDIAKTTETNVVKDSTTTTNTTYTYDSRDEHGNWTQRTTYDKKGKASKVTKRTITYYKKD